MTHKNYTVKDYSAEKSVFGWHTQQLLSDGSNLATIQTDNATMLLAVYGVCRFASINNQQLVEGLRGSQAANPNPEAQREEKWLCTYEDVSEYLDPPLNTVPNPGYHKIFNLELPEADLSLRTGNHDIVFSKGSVPDNAAFTTLETEFNDVVRSPYGGNASLLEVRAVGRNT